MPKDTPIADLLKDAAAQCKMLDGFTKSAGTTAAQIDAGFRKPNPNLDLLTQMIDNASKWVSQIEFDIGKAEKVMKQLAKRKEPEAKNPVKQLDKSLSDTDKAVEALRGTIAVTEKLASKIEGDDKKLIQAMKTALALGAQRLKDCTADAVNGPALTQNLGSTVAKVKAEQLPVSYYLQVVRTFVRDVNEIKVHLDEGDRITDTLGKVGTAGGRAALPEARKLADDCTDLKKKLDAALDKVRPAYKTALTSAAKWRDELADKIKNAA